MNTFVAASLLLQNQPAQTGSGGSGIILLVELAALLGIFYWWRIPAQKQRQRHETALKSLKRGDEVVTAGGIIGEVIHIREMSKEANANRLDDRITIKSGESRIVVERGKISRVNGAATADSTSKAASPAE